jgi:hypothetical protein
MNIEIQIECETVSELFQHIDELRNNIKKYVGEHNINMLLEDALPTDMVLEDSNCYGYHQLKLL